MQLLKGRHLGQFGCHHELAADLDRDAVLFGEASHGRRSGRTELRLEAAGSVVQARMNNAGVVAGLMLGYARLLLQHGDGVSAPDQLGGGREP